MIGWYHTGPRLREADIDIHALMARYCDNPLLVICEVQVGGQADGRAGGWGWMLAGASWQPAAGPQGGGGWAAAARM